MPQASAMDYWGANRRRIMSKKELKQRRLVVPVAPVDGGAPGSPSNLSNKSGGGGPVGPGGDGKDDGIMENRNRHAVFLNHNSIVAS